MSAQTADRLGAVLVTGATGHIGRPLVSTLVERGQDVTVLTRAPELAERLWPRAVRIVKADLADSTSLTSALDGIDTLFHLACYTPEVNEPSPFNARGHWEVTAIGTANLVARMSGSHLKRLVYLCSVRALGKQPKGAARATDETAVPMPNNLYGQATLTAERHLLALGPAAGIKTSVLRLPSIYGFDEEGDLARLVGSIAARRFPPWPRIDNKRSAIHVRDAIAAAILIAESPGSATQIYHATDGKAYSTRWIYEQVMRELGRPLPKWTLPLWLMRAVALGGSATEQILRRRLPLTLGDLATLANDAWFSSEKLTRTLGFQPKHDLAGEIQRLTGRKPIDASRDRIYA